MALGTEWEALYCRGREDLVHASRGTAVKLGIDGSHCQLKPIFLRGSSS